jgi:hypothetical protein
MYIETVPNRNSPPCILLRESFRHEGKVKHRTLANLTDWPKHIVAGLRLLLNGHQPSLTVSSESFRIIRSLPHGNVEAVLRVVRILGLDRLLGSKLSPERNLALAMIVTRILDPGSKLATARSLDCQTLSSTLAQECHLEGSIHENEGNPSLAKHRRAKREALLRAIEVELEKIVLATKRKKRRLRGKAKIALRVGRLIEGFKMAKHFVLQIRPKARSSLYSNSSRFLARAQTSLLSLRRQPIRGHVAFYPDRVDEIAQ